MHKVCTQVYLKYTWAQEYFPDDQQLMEYNKKKSDIDREAFILTTIRMFLNQFPVSLGEAEPSEDHLKMVDDSTAQVEELLPEEGTDEYEEAWEKRRLRAVR